jgi:manganese oxidase
MHTIPLRSWIPLAGGALAACQGAVGSDASMTAAPACAVHAPMAAPPRALANDQRVPAGRAIGDTVAADLDIRTATLLPEGEAGPHLVIAGFGEAGGPTLVPGPLVRAPAGTTVRATICNTLLDTVWVIGLAARGDTVTVPPGVRVPATFGVDQPGFREYRGLTRSPSGGLRPAGPTGQLAGGVVVDGAHAWGDRIFVITDWAPPPGDAEDQPFALLINGRSWPHTERLRYAIGDTARWIVINASPVEHPMHLHGFHFTVLARTDALRDSVYAADRRRLAVTETLLPGQNMAMEWVPERGGRWLFHCHIASHMGDVQRYNMLGQERPEPATLHTERHAERGMAGLVMGIEVEGDPAAGLAGASAADTLRLTARPLAVAEGEEPAYAYAIDGRPAVAPAGNAPAAAVAPGPPIVLTRGRSTAVTIVNRLPVATAVHWHGLEIESYFDGVPGWTGDGRRTTPMIMPGDSFPVRLMPPRAGTFIYHSHADEGVQLTRGLVGPLLVLEPGRTYDPRTDHVLLFSVAGSGADAPVVANGGSTPAVVLEAGRTHRIRIINITAEDLVSLEIRDGEELMEWTVAARDGADLPAALTFPAPAALLTGPGQTVDVLLAPTRAADLRLVVRSYNDFETILRVRQP